MQSHFQMYVGKTKLLLYIQVQITKSLMLLNNTNDGKLIL